MTLAGAYTLWYAYARMDIIAVLQIWLSVILIILVLLQRSDASAGGAFGGSDEGGITRTRRGPEKAIFLATIVVAILFVVLSIATLIY